MQTQFPRKKIALIIAAIVVGSILGVLWIARSTGFGSRYRQKHPSRPLTGTSLYLDDTVCADCHENQSNGFKKTGHANTFRKAIDSSIAKGLAEKSFQDPQRGYEYRYHFDQESGLSVSLPQKFGEDRFPLTYELGSGHHAVTFLTLIPNRLGDTVGIEHRVTMYRGKDGWEMDLTPGHLSKVPQQDVEQFGETIAGDKLTKCVACHTTTAEINYQELADLRPNVRAIFFSRELSLHARDQAERVWFV